MMNSLCCYHQTVIEVLKATLRFMKKEERIRFYSLVGLRALNGVFDLLGVLVIGYLAASIAAFLASKNNSNQNQTISFAGLMLPALTASSLPIVATTVVCIFSLKALFSIYLTRKLARELAIIEARSSKQILENVFSSGLDSSGKFSREEIYFSIQTGSSAAFNGILNSVSTLFSEGFLFFILFSSFVFLSPWATLGLFIFLSLIALAIQYFVGIHLAKASQELVGHNVSAMSAVDNLYRVYREISVMGRANIFISKVYKSRLDGASSLATQTYLLGMPRYIIETALIFGIFVFGFIQSLSGDLAGSISIIGVFLTGGFRILAAMLPFQAAFSSIKSLVAPAKTALDLISIKPAEEKVPIVAWNPKGPVKVVAENITFAFDESEHQVLKNVSFTIEPGQQVALVGPSGAGKSTLVDVVLGLRKPSSGLITLDGVAPNLLTASGQSSIAYVPQKIGIISGSVLDNVALGTPEKDVNLDQVRTALEMANLIDAVDALPFGIHSDLGKHANALSGGQMQRLGLARAFYGKPAFLVMDEGTSGLDAASEYEIGRVLDSLRGTVTVLLVAHRLNTVKNSDIVLVLEAGQVVATGKFAEVLKANPGIAKAAKLVSLEPNHE
jgi:ATP-binding cassette subfamily C protein